jgi:hypothetical protein
MVEAPAPPLVYRRCLMDFAILAAAVLGLVVFERLSGDRRR